MLKNSTISKDEKPLLRGPEYGFNEIVANGAAQKK